jgi:hypothetical protein
MTLEELAAERGDGGGEPGAAVVVDASRLLSRTATFKPSDAARQPVELARQLTLYQSRLFRAVSRRALLGYVLRLIDRDDPAAAPIRTFITYLNKVCRGGRSLACTGASSSLMAARCGGGGGGSVATADGLGCHGARARGRPCPAGAAAASLYSAGPGLGVVVEGGELGR